MRKIYLFVLITISVFTACEDEIDLTAPYKDIAIVYGLLNPNDTVHYIRIEKAFLVNDNALLYSTIPDSIYYPPGLIAYMIGYNQAGQIIDSIYLHRVVNEFPKDSGLFASFNNVLYKGIGPLENNSTYKLTIIKPNGDTVRASTKLTGDIYMMSGAGPHNWEPSNVIVQNKIVRFVWASDGNTYAYQLALTFHYDEWKANNPGNVSHLSVKKLFIMFKNSDQFECIPDKICFEVSKPQFYSMVTSKILPDPAGTAPSQITFRRFTSLDVNVYGASEDLYKYITLNAPSLSYVQKVESYTNIKNGLGIFACRVSGGHKGMQLNQQTLDSLRYGQFTHDLNFVP